MPLPRRQLRRLPDSDTGECLPLTSLECIFVGDDRASGACDWECPGCQRVLIEAAHAASAHRTRLQCLVCGTRGAVR